MPIIQDRLDQLANLTLKLGSHSPDSQMCVMEAVAWVAGEEWSDHPVCASAIISAFLRAWNDALPSDAERDRLLKPLVPRLVGTKNGKALETRRAVMAADWLVRVHTPAWLRLAGLAEQAKSLEQFPEIISMAQIPLIRGPLEAIRQDARAAGDAAWATAGAAAGAAARAAAAAGDAARAAAGDAARAAAWAAAGAAAWAAARAAAWAASKKELASTEAVLQESALELVNRMIDAK